MLFGSRTATPVTRDQALPGRGTPVTVPGRHTVKGTPLTPPWPEGHEVLYVAMGCFWGAERIFWRLDGVHTTAVGYMGGFTPNPTYEETCTGRTGHTETAVVVYDPAVVPLERLLKEFWENHDPTTPNRQGNDVGTQYRSAIFTTTDEQLQVARDSRERYQRALAADGYGQVVTEIRPASEAGEFFYAEDYHQQYLAKNPNGYCNHGFCQVGYDMAAHGQGVARAQLPEA
jgi:peptide-methionine (S)-S-oxide reductase